MSRNGMTIVTNNNGDDGESDSDETCLDAVICNRDIPKLRLTVPDLPVLKLPDMGNQLRRKSGRQTRQSSQDSQRHGLDGSAGSANSEPLVSDRLGERPLVSVIVPIYKVERYLDECVSGIVNQTYRNLEIILVDDGSPDDCPRMCDEWAAKDERIRVIHKPNGGLSDARNAGLAQATGDCIYFVDSDDAVAPNLVERSVDTMREYEADLVMFKFDTISENGKPLLSDYKHNDFDEIVVLTPQEALKAQVKAEIDGYFWSFMATANIYKDHDFSFPVGRKIEDMARICNVIGEATLIVRIPEVLYHYRLRGGSIMSSWTPQLPIDWAKAADDREEYIVSRYPELKTFMTMQQLTFFANLDYETIRQSLGARLGLDPEEADRLRRRIEGLEHDVVDAGEEVPESTRKLIDMLRDGLRDGVTDNVADNFADNFKEMREEWHRISASWRGSIREAREAKEEAREEARIARQIQKTAVE
ncbi:family 2 glycosyl transferase [Bifidobacterium tissieri]|uniref:Family 2 glycosyl transferase n=1 Tax=Bifidobacterium tissieri TaxID=1630162 RepID=A0A261FE43_9BIFI|nr:family 2 glycosyl transferase [Bifidobacterium tissieri]